MDRMSDELGAVTVRTIQRLMREGITEEDARDLINLLGINWPALLREAQLIAKDRPQGLGAMGNQTEDDKA